MAGRECARPAPDRSRGQHCDRGRRGKGARRRTRQNRQDPRRSCRRSAVPAWSRAATPGSTIASARTNSARGRECLAPEETLELTGHPVGGVCPFGLRNPLPVYLDCLAQGLRHCLSRRGIAQHVGRGSDRATVRARRRTLGGPMPPARAKRAGSSSFSVTSGDRPGRAGNERCAIAAIAGEVWRPNPPCPASQKNPSASGAKPTARDACRA